MIIMPLDLYFELKLCLWELWYLNKPLLNTDRNVCVYVYVCVCVWEETGGNLQSYWMTFSKWFKPKKKKKNILLICH